MAKGDQKKEQKDISGMQNTFMNNYTATVPNQLQTYNNMMDAYKNYATNPFGNPFGGSAAYGSNQSGLKQPLSNTGNPTMDQIVNTANQIGRPDIANNPQYWYDQITDLQNRSGEPIDWGYWSGKMASANGGPSSGLISGYNGSFSSPAYGYYQNFASGGNNISMDPEFRGAMSKALGGYSNFADTGGFSPQDIQDIRARAISPVRAVYANAQNNIDRQRSLQGGYSPNYTAATAKMSRELANSIADQVTNANAGIAQMVQQGKLAGLGGLSSTGASGAGLQAQIDQFNKNLQLAGAGGMAGLDQFGAQLGLSYDQLQQAAKQFGLSGMQSLYSATPGLSNMFGNQALDAARLGSANAQATPGFPWQQVLGGIGTGLTLASSMGAPSALGKVGAAMGGKYVPGTAPTTTTGTNFAPGVSSSFVGPVAPISSLVPTAEGIGAGGALAGGGVLPGATTLPGMPASTIGSAGSGTSAASALGGGLATAGISAIPAVTQFLFDKYLTNQRPLDQYSIDQNTQQANDLFNIYGLPEDGGYNPYTMYLLENQVDPNQLVMS